MAFRTVPKLSQQGGTVEQQALFHDSLTDALTDCVRALGGNKAVGKSLWPEKSVDDARRALLDCLNPDRAQRLSPDQVLWVLREARKVSCHAAMTYIARECGYADPQPIEPEDERAALQREFTQSVRKFEGLVMRIEQLGART